MTAARLASILLIGCWILPLDTHATPRVRADVQLQDGPDVPHDTAHPLYALGAVLDYP